VILVGYGDMPTTEMLGISLLDCFNSQTPQMVTKGTSTYSTDQNCLNNLSREPPNHHFFEAGAKFSEQ